MAKYHNTPSGLVDFFTDAVKEFNKHSDFLPYLEDNAIVYSVNYHDQYTPKDVAAAYIELQYQDNPTFTIPSPKNMNVALNKNGTAAIIQGVTTWTDDNHPGEPLRFRCTFVFDAAQKTWFFKTLWAADRSDE